MITCSHISASGARLGNQMFQYTALRSVSYCNNMPFVLQRTGHLLLQVFKMSGVQLVDEIEVIYQYQEHTQFDPKLFELDYNTKSLDLRGFFWSPGYANMCKDILKDDFIFHDGIVDQGKQFMSTIPSSNVAAVSFRRGDFLNCGGLFEVLPMSYYQKALSTMSNDVILVFSDDINWCREQPLLQDERFVFVDLDFDVSLFLMTQCSYHIIANSSFSWWGAYLSNSKLVIGPSQWFGPNMHQMFKSDRILPSHWLTI